MLHALLENCQEYGDCWLWSGVMANGSPQVFLDGRYQQCRRLMFTEVIGAIPDRLQTVMRCREARCLNADHMMLMTVREVAQLASREGRFSSPQRRASITRGMRARSTKMNPEKVALVRACATAVEAANKYGIHKSMASRIRRGEAWAEVLGASVFTFRP